MSKVVAKDVAIALRYAGFPQEMRVGDYGYHPMSMLVRCTHSRKRDKNVQPVDNPVLKAPTIEEARVWMSERGLNFADPMRYL